MTRRSRQGVLRRMIPEVLGAARPGPLAARAAVEAGVLAGPCGLLAVGKAAAAMAAGVRDAGLPAGPVLVVGPAGPPGAAAAPGVPGAETLAADHPVPTARSVAAAARARAFVASMDAGETLLVLLSGGASAMLCLPREPLTLADLAAVTDALLRAGAPIGELNAVRKHCEVLKGGGLAAASGAGRVITLILSDVLGDPLDVIGSGPTAPDPTTFADALAVLERRGALDASPAVTALLRRGVAGEEPETVKPGGPRWARVDNRVIGNNRLATDAAAEACARAGFKVVQRRGAVEGEAAEVGRGLARAAAALAAASDAPAVVGGAIVWGGETTVTVGGAPGLGGRNQELALAAAVELERAAPRGAGVTMLSLATDGRDGPTDAAGAVVDGSTAAAIRAAGIDPADALARHDSHRALDAAGALVRTGPTGTNVNDVMLALWGVAR